MTQGEPDQSVALLAVEGEVATITLNRPEAFNAINYDMAVRLKTLAAEVDAQPSVKVVVIRGAGKAFCGGGDIRHFIDHLDDIGTCIRDLLVPYHEFLVRIHAMPKLVLASVHGSAAGAGLSLVSMCDFCIVADDAKFVPAYAKIGVSPDGGGTYGLARAIGQRRALQVQLDGSAFSAGQAEAWGLASKRVPPAELARATADYAAQLARTSAEAIANTKRLLRAGERATLEDHLVDEMESLIRCMGKPDFASAIGRFVDKG
ncbi:enoyl-CoA hydratase/isomerase family protein [Sphingobium estronivorans]|uniref:enoyl-CoA hydratase/isomerase family protein n=1 Tax=Sphingobium estronivorans TaxID=1577690 RepID=UPI0013C349F7|nr:enoyl-CoA hydratase-related protein [Sphingobium estronivorans]